MMPVCLLSNLGEEYYLYSLKAGKQEGSVCLMGGTDYEFRY